MPFIRWWGGGITPVMLRHCTPSSTRGPLPCKCQELGLGTYPGQAGALSLPPNFPTKFNLAAKEGRQLVPGAKFVGDQIPPCFLVLTIRWGVAKPALKPWRLTVRGGTGNLDRHMSLVHKWAHLGILNHYRP